MLTLEPMRATDLDLVTAWLDAPEVARWYSVGSTIAEEIDELHRCIVGVEPTTVLLVVERTKPIGWCQWYLCRDYPEHAREVGADPDDAGIDYGLQYGIATGVGEERIPASRRAATGVGADRGADGDLSTRTRRHRELKCSRRCTAILSEGSALLAPIR